MLNAALGRKDGYPVYERDDDYKRVWQAMWDDWTQRHYAAGAERARQAAPAGAVDADVAALIAIMSNAFATVNTPAQSTVDRIIGWRVAADTFKYPSDGANFPRQVIAALTAQQQRIGSLQASLDLLHGRRFSERNYTAMHSRAEAAEARAAANAKDAERYRWLRPQYFAVDWSYETGEGEAAMMLFAIPNTMRGSANLDAAIDAAIAKGAEHDRA
jgi:hypothetical protein